MARKIYGGWPARGHDQAAVAAMSALPANVRPRAVDWERVLLPFLALAVAFGLAQSAHHAWGDTTIVFWACLLMTLSNSGLTALTWQHVHERSLIGRAHLTANTFITGTWITIATYTGPFTRPTADIGVWLGATLAVAWLIRHGVHGDDTNTGGTSVGRAVRTALDAVGLDAVASTVTDVDGPRVATQLKVPANMTVADVANRLPNLESAGELPQGMATVIPDPDDSSRAELVMLIDNVLRQPIPWPGPLNPGGSIADAPMALGVYNTARHVLFNLYTPEGANHLLIAGMSGAGKSELAKGCMATLMHTSDTVIWAIDVSKGAQTLGDALPGLDWAVITGDDGDRSKAKNAALDLFDALTDVIAARAAFLGRNGLANWHPRAHTDLGMPFLVVWIEEAPDVLNLDDEVVVEILRAARSAGVSIVVSAQRGTSDMLPNSAKQQIPAAMCFGMKGAQEVTYVLSEKLTDNGVQPAVWGRDLPGMAYLEAPGIPLAQAMTPWRAYQLREGDSDGPGDLAAAAAWRAASPVDVDPVTSAAAGAAYARRSLTSAAVPAAPEDDGTARELQEVTMLTRRLLADIHDPDPDLHVPDDFDDDTTPPIPMPAPHVENKAAKVAAATPILEAYLDTLAGQGAYTKVAIADAIEPQMLGLSRSWIFKKLREYSEGDQARLIPVDETDIRNAGKDAYRIRSKAQA